MSTNPRDARLCHPVPAPALWLVGPVGAVASIAANSATAQQQQVPQLNSVADSAEDPGEPVYAPVVDGPRWTVARNPDLGDLTGYRMGTDGEDYQQDDR